MEKLILENNIVENREIENNQNSFLKSTLGIALNEAVNYGIKKIVPDFIEDQVINIKDNILNNGIKEGINTAIESAIDLGKSAMGIFTGKFEKISQIETAVQKGGLIDATSNLIDKGIKLAEKNDLINKDIYNTLKTGKNIMENSLEESISDILKEQKSTLNKVENSIEKWNEYKQENNFEKMDLEYNKIKNNITKIIPIEQTLNRVAELENIHNLIKNNGNNFELTNEQIYLAKKLV